MEPLVVASLSAVFVAGIASLFVYARKWSFATLDTDSSDDDTSGPLSVNVVANHDEQDSLLPKFAGLLRSPWHSVTTGQQKKPPKMMQTVRKGSRSMSLTLPLPLRKKRKPTEVAVKKVHVPYFFPLLDETAEWWHAQKCTAAESQPTPEQEPEAGSECDPSDDELHSSNQSREDTQVLVASAKELPQADRLHHFIAAKMAAAPIEVGGR